MQLPIISNLNFFKNVKKEEYAKYFELVPNFQKEKTQKFTTIALTLLASIILFVFAVGPTLSTIGNLQRQVDDNKFVEQKLKQKINNMSLLDQQYSNLEKDLDVVYSAVPKSPQIPLLLGEIQAIAKNSNIKLKTFQTFQVDVSQLATSNKKYSAFDFALSAEGNYQDMLIFLNNLVSFQRVITLDTVSIRKVSGFNISTLNLSIRGTAFFKE